MRCFVSRLENAAARSLSRSLALAGDSRGSSSAFMQAKHSALAAGAATLSTTVDSKLCGSPGASVSRHRLAGPVGLAALHGFQQTATQQAQGASCVFLGSHDGRIVLSVPERAPEISQRSLKRRRADAVEEETGQASARAERLAHLNGELETVPLEHRALMVKTLERLYELRAHDGERVVESLSTAIKAMPPPLQNSGLSARKALVVTARLMPGVAVSLQRVMSCLPPPVDGHLCCCNGSVLDQQTLPVGAHARAALEMGLTTLQLICSVGVPFVPLCAPASAPAQGELGPFSK